MKPATRYDRVRASLASLFDRADELDPNRLCWDVVEKLRKSDPDVGASLAVCDVIIASGKVRFGLDRAQILFYLIVQLAIDKARALDEVDASTARAKGLAGHARRDYFVKLGKKKRKRR